MIGVCRLGLFRLFCRAVEQAERLRTRSKRRRQATPGVESLEAMALLSTGMGMMHRAAIRLDHLRAHREVRHVTEPRMMAPTDVSSAESPVTSPAQTVSIGDTNTNFANLPLQPALNLFDPSLGTLLSVTVSHSGMVQSQVISQNLSPTSSTVITATVSASFEIDGLNQPITQPTTMFTSAPMAAGVFGSPTDTVTFPPFVVTNAATTTLTDSSSLAFYTSSSGRSAVTLTMTANAAAAASAPNGNLLTTTDSSASGTVTVTYTYLPVCPSVTSIGRIGLHHQQTELVVTFEGPVDRAKAENPANYFVITSSGKTIKIKSATFDPLTNAVTLIPAEPINVHHHFKLSVVLPCPNEQTGDTVVVPFGGKDSLIGFHNHHGEFVSVKNGRVVAIENHRDQLIPVNRARLKQLEHREARLVSIKDRSAPRLRDNRPQAASLSERRARASEDHRGNIATVKINGLDKHREKVIPVHYKTERPR
jgi:hypothetical protein